jgi:MFS family permease
MQAGAILGALISSPIADRKGRRPALLGVAILAFIGGLMQGLAFGHLPVFYIGRFLEGIGLGAGTSLAPTYVAENSPRAIRGFLTGFFQLLLDAGGMTAYFINYGSLLHLPGKATYIVPLLCQCIAPTLLFFSMLACPESPRWLASRDNWDKASAVLHDVRHLPVEHPYIQQELLELKTQLDQEKAVMGDATFLGLQKECWTVPGNRKRALLTILLLIFNQWSGVGTRPSIMHAVANQLTDWCHQLLCTHHISGPWSVEHNDRPLRTRCVRHCQDNRRSSLCVLPCRLPWAADLDDVEWCRASICYAICWVCECFFPGAGCGDPYGMLTYC